MKKLFIIRHAKSSWKDLSLDDFDRPLNKRGFRDAPFMGKLLYKKDIIPDVIISSPANRAKTTIETITKELKYIHNIIYNESIYDAALSSLINILKKIEDKNNIVFLVGHNPSLNALAYEFVGFEENIPTCGIIEIKFDTNNWADIANNNAKLISFEYPKKYINKD